MLPKVHSCSLHRKLPPSPPPLGFPFSGNLGVSHSGVPPSPASSSTAEGPLRRLNQESSSLPTPSITPTPLSSPHPSPDCSTWFPKGSLTPTYVFISGGWLTRHTWFKIQETPKPGGDRVSFPRLSPDPRISFSLEVTHVTSFLLIPLEIISIVKSKIIHVFSIHVKKSEQLTHKWVYYSTSPLINRCTGFGGFPGVDNMTLQSIKGDYK